MLSSSFNTWTLILSTCTVKPNFTFLTLSYFLSLSGFTGLKELFSCLAQSPFTSLHLRPSVPDQFLCCLSIFALVYLEVWYPSHAFSQQFLQYSLPILFSMLLSCSKHQVFVKIHKLWAMSSPPYSTCLYCTKYLLYQNFILLKWHGFLSRFWTLFSELIH